MPETLPGLPLLANTADLGGVGNVGTPAERLFHRCRAGGKPESSPSAGLRAEQPALEMMKNPKEEHQQLRPGLHTGNTRRKQGDFSWLQPGRPPAPPPRRLGPTRFRQSCKCQLPRQQPQDR